jgi:hypothetical protein
LVILFAGGTEKAMWIHYSVKPFGFFLKTIFVFHACRFFVENRQGALELLLSTPLTQQEILKGQIDAFRDAVLLPSIILVGTMLLALGLTTTIPALTGMFNPTTALFSGGVYCGGTIADLAAIFWVGTRLSLTMKKPQLAPALTILIVLVLPSMLCCFDFVADLILLAWARSALVRDWREWLVPGGNRPNYPDYKPPVIPDSPPVQP